MFVIWPPNLTAISEKIRYRDTQCLISESMDRPYMSFPRVTKFGYANDEDSQGPRWKRVADTWWQYLEAKAVVAVEGSSRNIGTIW